MLTSPPVIKNQSSFSNFTPNQKILSSSTTDSYPTPPPSPPRTLASMETTPETQSKPHPHRLPPGREDWWSEDATATLIEAWGDRYVNLSRGNLRQNDWKEVADVVNSIRRLERLEGRPRSLLRRLGASSRGSIS